MQISSDLGIRRYPKFLSVSEYTYLVDEKPQPIKHFNLLDFLFLSLLFNSYTQDSCTIQILLLVTVDKHSYIQLKETLSL